MNHNNTTKRLNEPSRNPHHSSVSKTPNNKYDKSDIMHITTNENKIKSKDLHIISSLKNENIKTSTNFRKFKNIY